MILDHYAGRLSELDREVVDAVPPGGNWRDLPSSFSSKRVDQIRESAARGEGSRSTYYGRLRWDRPAYTISTYFSRPGNGCFIHPESPRLITVREAARLQSFPDAYRFFGEGRSRFVQVGNAVPPLLAYQIAAVIPRGPALDLFSGAGGMSLGFEWAGFPLLAAVDVDSSANRAFSENRDHADLVMEADLSDPHTHSVVMQEVKRRAGDEGVQVLVGGPPCQGFSTAGNCRPNDPRNRLVFAFVDAAERLRPRYVLMENVPALLNRRRPGVLSEIRKALHALGYETSVIIAHAEAYGVPQLRRRLFLLAALRGVLRWPRPWLRLTSPARPNFQPGAEVAMNAPDPFTVFDAIGDLPLETMSSPDLPTGYSSPASSVFQAWARGEVPLSSVVPGNAFVTEPARLFHDEATSGSC